MPCFGVCAFRWWSRPCDCVRITISPLSLEFDTAASLLNVSFPLVPPSSMRVTFVVVSARRISLKYVLRVDHCWTESLKAKCNSHRAPNFRCCNSFTCCCHPQLCALNLFGNLGVKVPQCLQTPRTLLACFIPVAFAFAEGAGIVALRLHAVVHEATPL